jgi:hypothetical protein
MSGVGVAETVEKEMPIDLRLDQDKINKEDDEIMFNIFVREAFAIRALCKSDTLTKGWGVGFAVCRVEIGDWGGTCYADWHACYCMRIVAGGVE